ncbi:MAG: helix-turn-helix domain-containing protein [Chitinispirillaceae bacterium]
MVSANKTTRWFRANLIHLGLSVKDVIDTSGVSASVLYKLANGSRIPSRQTLQKISTAIDELAKQKVEALKK